ncbi:MULTISPECIES: hypothetical protein [unclassified Streptomyces]|uniref:hypothetical protein n=1 Tax=unclassified Streptomyces TaxID=2593676 RepID=UPI001C4F3400|nr:MULTISPECIES: hypothetical protein [unclassified Streptomyces]MCL6292831.1 hypothetical protein [Streptomyces sp. 43Y-GA-1]QXQ98374.1 hypothetical protein KV381_19920 [Streptomyces sp. WY228]
MFHRIRTGLPRALVHMALSFLARIRHASNSPASVSPSVPAPSPFTDPSPQSPYGQRPLRLDHPSRPHPLDPERRLRRTVMRLALDGLVVAAGVGQAYSTGSLVLASTRTVV